MKKLLLSVLAFTLMAGFGFAGTNKTLWKAYESGNYGQVQNIVNNSSLKTAEEYYLLGRVKLSQGDKIAAVKAWNEAIQISKNLGSKKWDFLFSPNKSLTGTQKKKIYNDFQDEFKQLGSALARLKKTDAKTASNKAVRTNIEAKRLDKVANAVSEGIKDKQKVADRLAKKKAVKKPVAKRGMKIPFGWVIGFILIFVAIIVFAATRKNSCCTVTEPRHASFGTTRYNVMRNDDVFVGGPFWYEGIYYHSSNDFYRRNNYYYTNNMYMDNYDQYGMGQGRDEALDEEIMRDIESRQELREESANLEAEAANLEQDAAEAIDEADELEDSMAAFDDEPEFGDDEPSAEEEPELEDDEPVFEDDEPAEEEEPEFEDDEPEFEDDEPEFEDDEE